MSSCDKRSRNLLSGNRERSQILVEEEYVAEIQRFDVAGNF